MDDKLRTYYEKMKSIDYSSLRIQTIDFFTLMDVPTRDLMTELRRTRRDEEWNKHDKDYKVYEMLLIKVCRQSLVVISEDDVDIYPIAEMPKPYAGCTMTKFKKEEIAYRLLNQEHSLLGKIRVLKKYELSLWEQPFQLLAQTYFDMDYRKEWSFGELVYEGNNYGDTSRFYIIGVLEERKPGELRKTERTVVKENGTVNIYVGDSVYHPSYGEGKVVKTDGTFIYCDFEDDEHILWSKTFVQGIAKIYDFVDPDEQ